jgi:transcriptional regulator with XRE-family HTH domain
MSDDGHIDGSPETHHRWGFVIALLVKARLDAGLTQEVVADRLGWPPSFVSTYERGGVKLDVGEFMEVCQALECNAVRLLHTAAAAFWK